MLTYARERNYEPKMEILTALGLPTFELPAYSAGTFLPYLQKLKAKRASEAAGDERPKIKEARERKGKQKVAKNATLAAPTDTPKPFTIKASRPRAAKRSSA